MDAGFRIVSMTHENCSECLDLVHPAIIHARVTGSVGCTYEIDRNGVPGGTSHSVEVARIQEDISPTK